MTDGLERQPQRDAERRPRVGQRRQVFFDNREYWETRYVTEPERGSGIGSRGEHLELKRALLESLIKELKPKTILDVGCGDLEVVKDLRFNGTLIGIDLSPTIIERNRQLRPDWTFWVGDFLELADPLRLSADLVICFDVLIHQPTKPIYVEFVRRLLGSARRTAVMNGFETRFKRGRQMQITSFHEPLSETLAQLGVRQANVIGRFRGTSIYRIDKADSASLEAAPDGVAAAS